MLRKRKLKVTEGRNINILIEIYTWYLIASSKNHYTVYLSGKEIKNSENYQEAFLTELADTQLIEANKYSNRSKVTVVSLKRGNKKMATKLT